MSCAATIRKDESHFNLAHRIVSVIVENNNLNFDAVWLQVSTNTIQQLQKRFRKIKRANNPLSDVKKPRTSFSFYTKNCREKIAKANPKATFGELSKLVSRSWSGLSDKEKEVYKKMEREDKERYRLEKEAVLAKQEEANSTSNTEAVEEESTSVDADAEQPAKTKKRKTTTKAKESKETKSSKGSTSKSTKTSSGTSSTKKSSGTKQKQSYNLFQKEQRPLIKKANPSMALKDVNSQLGTMWKALSDEEKNKYLVAA